MARDDLEQYYRTLDLESDASQEQIRRAWLDLTQVWHPDRFQGDPHLGAKAEKKLKAINKAYDVLQVSSLPVAQQVEPSAAAPGRGPDARLAQPSEPANQRGGLGFRNRAESISFGVVFWLSGAGLFAQGLLRSGLFDGLLSGVLGGALNGALVVGALRGWRWLRRHCGAALALIALAGCLLALFVVAMTLRTVSPSARGGTAAETPDSGLAAVPAAEEVSPPQALATTPTPSAAPATAADWYRAGVEKANSSGPAAAVPLYLEAIQLDSRLFGAWYDLGYAYTRLDRYEDALNAYRKALEINQNVDYAWIAWEDMGNNYARLGHRDYAIACYKRSLQLRPGTPEVQAALAAMEHDSHSTSTPREE